MKTIAIIPARGGSVGLPRKNIREIEGKPLIAWSIEQALSSKRVFDVYVSTNCPEIAKISLNYGAKVPFLRPEAISMDTSTTESAVIHFCQYLDGKKIDVDNILLIQCTSPVRARNRFDDAIDYFLNRNYDSLLSVTKSHKFYWRDLNTPQASYDIKNRPRRQDILEKDISYLETGSFYIFKKEQFVKKGNRIFGNVGLYKTPENEAIDIDSIIDFSICEKLLSSKLDEKTFAA